MALLALSGSLVVWLEPECLRRLLPGLVDFGMLVDGGLNTRRALATNLASALTFPLGALASLWAPDHLPLPALVSIGAGSFLYLAAVDLLPDVVRAQARRARLTGVASVVAGILLMGAIPHSHPPHGDNHNELSSDVTYKRMESCGSARSRRWCCAPSTSTPRPSRRLQLLRPSRCSCRLGTSPRR